MRQTAQSSGIQASESNIAARLIRNQQGRTEPGAPLGWLHAHCSDLNGLARLHTENNSVRAENEAELERLENVPDNTDNRTDMRSLLKRLDTEVTNVSIFL